VTEIEEIHQLQRGLQLQAWPKWCSAILEKSACFVIPQPSALLLPWAMLAPLHGQALLPASTEPPLQPLFAAFLQQQQQRLWAPACLPVSLLPRASSILEKERWVSLFICCCRRRGFNPPNATIAARDISYGKGIFYLAQVCDRFQRIALSLALSWLSSPSCLPSSPFATEYRSHSAAAQNRMMSERERERDSVVATTTTTTAAKISRREGESWWWEWRTGKLLLLLYVVVRYSRYDSFFPNSRTHSSISAEEKMPAIVTSMSARFFLKPAIWTQADSSSSHMMPDSSWNHLNTDSPSSHMITNSSSNHRISIKPYDDRFFLETIWAQTDFLSNPLMTDSSSTHLNTWRRICVQMACHSMTNSSSKHLNTEWQILPQAVWTQILLHQAIWWQILPQTIWTAGFFFIKPFDDRFYSSSNHLNTDRFLCERMRKLFSLTETIWFSTHKCQTTNVDYHHWDVMGCGDQ